MRGFQKGITLGGRTSGSTCKVMGGVGGTRGNMVWHKRKYGGWGGPYDFSVTPVQT